MISKYKAFSEFTPTGKYYYELWSGAGNLCGAFNTVEELFDATAEYIEQYGAEAIPWILEQIACRCLSSGRENRLRPHVIFGPEMLAEALKYG